MRFSFIVALALTGVLGGIVGVAFHYLLQFAFSLSYGSNHFTSGGLYTNENLPQAATILLPALGGLVVGLIVWLSNNKDLGGEGVPSVTRWLASRTQPQKFLTAPLKALTAIITIGSGGSAGREGPIIAVGGALGADVGVLTKRSPEEQRVLLLAGAASAMAATFGTPAAALIFIFELFDRRPSRRTVYAVLFSILIASAVAQILFNYHGLSFAAPSEIISAANGIGLLLVAIFAGVVAASFSALLQKTKGCFDGLRLFLPLKPALGGLGVGILVTLLPYLYEPATMPLITTLLEKSTALPLLLLLAILVAKFMATILTVGSGGSGGIFAPSLVLGGILGACVASVLTIFGLSATASMLVLVGMAAVFAGIAHTPFAAAFLLFEMTDSLPLFPILLLATFTSYTIAKKIKATGAYHLDA